MNSTTTKKRVSKTNPYGVKVTRRRRVIARQLHIPPLYRVNVTYKLGVYRVTFLMGKQMAQVQTLARCGIEFTYDTTGKARFFSGHWRDISKITGGWMERNRR